MCKDEDGREDQQEGLQDKDGATPKLLGQWGIDKRSKHVAKPREQDYQLQALFEDEITRITFGKLPLSQHGEDGGPKRVQAQAFPQAQRAQPQRTRIFVEDPLRGSPGRLPSGRNEP